MKNLLLATRPKTLITGLSPLLISFGVLKNLNLEINYVLFSLTCLCVLLLQVGTNLVNDYYDGIRGIDDDSRLGPQRFTASNIIKPETIRKFFRIVFILAFAIGIYISIHSSIYVFLLGLTSLVVAYAYTGGPFPLSYFRLGEFLAFIFFGPVAVIGSYLIQNEQIPNILIILSCGTGTFSSLLMFLNNYRDIETDTASGKKTVPNFIGPQNTKSIMMVLSFLPLIISLGLGYFYNIKTLYLTLFMTPLIYKFLKFIKNTSPGPELNNGLLQISLLNLSWCLINCVGLCLI